MPSLLLVEYIRVSVMIYESLLKFQGFTVTVAKTSQEAVDLVSAGNKFDVIMINKHMPVMNGIALTKMLKSMNVKSLFVGIAIQYEEDSQVFLEAGLDLCFPASLTFERIAKITELLQNQNVSSSKD